MTVHSYALGPVRLTRVGYADVLVPAEVVGLTAEQVVATTWREPVWAEGEQVRVAAAAWVIDDGDVRVVVDPAFAADEILRNDNDADAHQQAFAALLADAGFPRESVTHAVPTHAEGIGMLGWREGDGSWSPFFPNATVLFSQRELDALDDGRVQPDAMGALAQLRAQGRVAPVTGDRFALTERISLEHTGGHSPGHQVVRVHTGDGDALVLGHLAVSALHIGLGPCPPEHMDPVVADERLRAYEAEDALLIGPLWPAPGAGRWDGERLTPAASPRGD
jgi:glyoxylase-like metal-dependent hydrolase (beta-lactamase superfamily II)